MRHDYLALIIKVEIPIQVFKFSDAHQEEIFGFWCIRFVPDFDVQELLNHRVFTLNNIPLNGRLVLKCFFKFRRSSDVYPRFNKIVIDVT